MPRSAPDVPRLETMTEAERKESFFFQPVLKRAAIVVAGPMANFVLAIVIFAMIFALYGKQTMSARVDAFSPTVLPLRPVFNPAIW